MAPRRCTKPLFSRGEVRIIRLDSMNEPKRLRLAATGRVTLLPSKILPRIRPAKNTRMRHAQSLPRHRSVPRKPGLWPDFHARFVPALCDALVGQLPAPYVARIDERMNLVELEAETVTQF